MLRKKRKTEETTGLLLRHEESASKRPWLLQVNTGNFLIKAEFTTSPVSSCFVGGCFKEKHPITKYLLFPLCSFKLIPKHFPGFACGSSKRIGLQTQETWVPSLGREDPLEKEMADPHQCSLPGKSHGQRSLVGYSPWSHKRVGCDLATRQQQQVFPTCTKGN